MQSFPTARSVSHLAPRLLLQCYKKGVELGSKISRTSIKPWDQEFWCGDFATSLVCVQSEDGSDVPTTMEYSDALEAGRTVLHCGRCGACSNLHDMNVIDSTKKFITTKMTGCATAFAKPKLLSGHQDLGILEDCLRASGIDFSTDRRAWPTPNVGKPSCMQCWTDNIQCDAVNCKTNLGCIKKFFDPDNDGDFAGCLQCDDERCGAEFIKCAGSNRRSSGISSDITRPGDQVCPHALYSGATAAPAVGSQWAPTGGTNGAARRGHSLGAVGLLAAASLTLLRR